MKRIRTVEYDSRMGGWIARHPVTGQEITEEGFRWWTRASARDVVRHARLWGDRKAAASIAQPSKEPNRG